MIFTVTTSAWHHLDSVILISTYFTPIKLSTAPQKMNTVSLLSNLGKTSIEEKKNIGSMIRYSGLFCQEIGVLLIV